MENSKAKSLLILGNVFISEEFSRENRGWNLWIFSHTSCAVCCRVCLLFALLVLTFFMFGKLGLTHTFLCAIDALMFALSHYTWHKVWSSVLFIHDVWGGAHDNIPLTDLRGWSLPPYTLNIWYLYKDAGNVSKDKLWQIFIFSTTVKTLFKMNIILSTSCIHHTKHHLNASQ